MAKRRETYYNRKGQLQMIKRITVFLLAVALLLSVPACSMPDAIFSDEIGSEGDQNEATGTADIYGFEFKMGEFDMQLPEKYSALSARGWKISEAVEPADEEQAIPADTEIKVYTADSVLEPGEYSDYLPLSSGDSVINARFYNDGRGQKAITDCNVVGIRLDAEYENVPEFIIQKDNLSVGSRYDVVINSCGKPTYIEKKLKSTGETVAINDVKFIETDEDTVSTLYYKLTDHALVSFGIDKVGEVENAVVTVTIENDTEPYKPYDYSKEIKYTPGNIDLYKGPNLLGKQCTDFAFKYEGHLYTLPIPVRRLLADGWDFVSGYGERIPMGTTADGLIMRKGNQSVRLMIHNFDTKYAHTAVNCYAVSMEACLTGPNVDILLFKGVTLGTSEKDLVDAFGKDFVKNHPVVDEEGNYTENPDSFQYEIPDMTDCYINKTVGEDYIVYSCVMPDDVPIIELPVSITDIGDIGADMLGDVRKHIDIYVTSDTHLIYKFYLKNCPEYVVDENKIIEEQMEAQRKKEKEEWEKLQKEKEEAEKKKG